MKKLDREALATSSSFQSASDTYDNILKICKAGPKVPPVSLDVAEEILKSIRPSVNDFFSITAAHYINSGSAGLAHFSYLINSIIEDMNNMTIVNTN